jgi:hypothetical protein
MIATALLWIGFAGADTSLRDGTLAGLTGVDVVVAKMSGHAADAGITQVWGETYLEERLTEAGVPLLTLEERLQTPGFPYLFLTVTVTRVGEHPLFAYTVRLELQQSVLLDRDRTIHAPAPTWSSAAKLGYAGELKVEAAIKEIVGAMAGEFITAYAAANPQRQ